MRPISQKNKDTISTEDFYKKCCVSFLGGCDGRITIDHTLIYKGQQVDDIPFLIPICAKHHGVDFYQDARTEAPKDLRLLISLNRADDETLLKYSKVINYIYERNRLNEKYKHYLTRNNPIKKE